MTEATKKHTFISKFPGLRIVIEPSRPIRNSRGDRIGVEPGQDVQFQGNVLLVEDDDYVTVETDRFDEDGNRRRKTVKLADWLRDRTAFNRDYYDRGAPPHEPKPTVSEQISSIIGARTPEQIEAVIALEMETHKRNVVLEAAEQALAAQRNVAEVVDEEESPSQPSSSSKTASTTSSV